MKLLIALFCAWVSVAQADMWQNEFIERAKELIVTDERVAGDLQEQIVAFLDPLCEGEKTEITGDDRSTRPVAVTAQGAIEEVVSRFIEEEKVKGVQIAFITPLPASPLRKAVDPSLEGLRQYTLDKREQTVRHLLDAGATVYLFYEQEAWSRFKENPLHFEQVANFSKMLEEYPSRLKSMPVDRSIPQEFVGAYYMLPLSECGVYGLILHGRQIQDQQEGKWEILMGPLPETSRLKNGMAEANSFLEEALIRD